MVYVLIGHRGVGKTQFLERVRHYYEALRRPVAIYDLDREIVMRKQKSIEALFSEQGEGAFRKIESEVLDQLLSEVSRMAPELTTFIALGAGFSGNWPAPIKALWVHRPTDKNGRIFLDRPRLNREVSPFDEYLQRFEAREARYKSLYTKEISLAEGFTFLNEIEPILLGLKPFQLRAGFTVLPHLFENELRLKDFLFEKQSLGATFFELRDDLLSLNQCEKVMSLVPADKILFSFRSGSSFAPDEWLSKYSYDWALEQGPCPYDNPSILSLHHRIEGESVDESAERLLSHKAQHYKLALTIHNYLELWAGHQWYLQDPKKRSFLPMSPAGVKEPLWMWYRLLFGPQMKISFVKELQGSAFDQPSLFDAIRVQLERRKSTTANFAALIGNPVTQSWTPSEHSQFFSNQNWPVVTICISENENLQLAMSVLERLGLSAAAVTAPFKEAIGRIYGAGATNTICKNSKTQKWQTANTDIQGFKKLISMVPTSRDAIAVWGGGGTLEALRMTLNESCFFSARTPEGAEKIQPNCVIWAVGRSRMPACQWPPDLWRPDYVVDLNYSEDSPGREYALRVGANYISGAEMFKAQAAAQRDFWSSHL